jgi:hypothetical protein
MINLLLSRLMVCPLLADSVEKVGSEARSAFTEAFEAEVAHRDSTAEVREGIESDADRR